MTSVKEFNKLPDEILDMLESENKSQPMTVRLPISVFEDLSDLADANNTSRHSLVQSILVAFVKQQRK